MDALRLKSQANRRALGASYLRASEVSDGLPVYLNIESTSICNLKCVMCPYPDMGRKNEHMAMSLYERIIHEGRGHVEFIWLHLFGEPLLKSQYL
jgi:sulfatase maturation enzyme AslB (radical SAM superfamily)